MLQTCCPLHSLQSSFQTTGDTRFWKMVDVYRPQHVVGEGGYKDSGISAYKTSLCFYYLQRNTILKYSKCIFDSHLIKWTYDCFTYHFQYRALSKSTRPLRMEIYVFPFRLTVPSRFLWCIMFMSFLPLSIIVANCAKSEKPHIWVYSLLTAMEISFATQLPRYLILVSWISFCQCLTQVWLHLM